MQKIVKIYQHKTLLLPRSIQPKSDWLVENLKDDEFRKMLITRRLSLTLSIRRISLCIAVKKFLIMHFELPVCVKYSCSGRGRRLNIIKKKLDIKTLSGYVFESFKQAFPDIYTLEEITYSTKAIRLGIKGLERKLTQELLTFRDKFDSISDKVCLNYTLIAL